MKVWFVIGTAAELIKMLPVIDESERRGLDWYMVSTGQSGTNLWKQYADFGLPEKRVIRLLDSTFDLSSSTMALKWFLRALFRGKQSLRARIEPVAGRSPEAGDFWFVHGDTFSTLLGSVYGRRFHVKIVHVEAGMRSHDIFNPFPEELNRRLVSRLAHFHMAPDQNAVKNLRAGGIEQGVTDTRGNTVLDALDVALSRFHPKDLPSGAYAVANIHRFENLRSDTRWNKIIDILVEASKQVPLYLVMMPNTAAKLERDVEARRRLEEAKITLMPRLPFSRFVHFMHKARFIVTDGGSNQQECFHFGLPGLIMREKTESIEGIGGCCVLSRFDDGVIRDFFADPQKFRREPERNRQRPTDLIFSALAEVEPNLSRVEENRASVAAARSR